jgi:hypothetical protein
MKISIISDPSGKIVAASFSPANTPLLASQYATDQIKMPRGHRVHEVGVPPELASEFLSGNLAQVLSKCTLEIKGKKAILKPQRSKK